ncbi:MAG: ATP-dependent helicase, partial [Clostridiales bacterium]|nr:ATP-dependent helicase [Clostridiales bacterium]
MLWDNGLENGSPIYNFAVDDSRVIRVVAGPGAGKTFALQRRIMRLLEKDKIPPEKILVITYSKAAAEYLKNDILNIGIEGAEGIVAATLHGLCYNLISKNSNIAQARHLRILHQFEQKPMLYDLHMRYGTLQQKKERIRAFEAKLETGGSSEEWFAEVVLEWLENHNAMLFGEIITQTIRYLRENPFCPEMSKFSHVLVDEYQDLNKMEQTVVDLLSANGNLTVIGDGEQSIYGFKHAHPDGIRDFGETHKGCSDHEFWECRRCPKTVAEMAQHLMSHSGSRATKAVMPFEGNQAGEVETVVSETSQDEAKKIAGMIKAEIDSGQIGIEDVLVLVPMRNIADNLREELTALGISTKSFFKERVLKTDQQKKAFSMLNLLANPDDMVSLRFLLGQGGGECRAMNYEKLLEYANKNGLAVLDVLGKCARGELKIPYTIKLAKVYADVRRELDDLKAKVPSAPMELAGMLIEDAPENREFRELLGEA